MSNAVRRSGIDIIGDVPWGTHFCQFYQTKQDLIDTLVPYFKAGLENNEFCMWVTADNLTADEARKAISKAVTGFSKFLKNGQIEILSYDEWYLKGGDFNSERVLNGWVTRLDQALKNGFDGLRLTGNTFWLEKEQWRSFTDYEEAVNNVIGKYNIVALCTYCLDKCDATEIVDVIRNHEFAMIKQAGKWELFENSRYKTTKEALVESERQLQQLYHSMIEGLALHDVVCDKAGRATDYVITDINPAFERITGIKTGDAIGKKASELYGTNEPPYLEIYSKVADTGEATKFETYFQPMEKHFAISVFSPEKGKFATVFFDITERKHAEEAVRQLNEQLKHHADELESANRELEAFSYSVSHDLRVPLRSMEGFSQALLEDYFDRLDEEGRDYLRRIQNSADLMSQLIDDMLRLSQLARLDMHFETVNLSEMASAVLSSLKKIQPERKVELNITPGLSVQGDAILLRVVVENLLGNAWKFSGKVPLAQIQFGVNERRDKKAYFVRDNGAGFDTMYVDKLFKPFQRLHSASEFPGTGIGLASVQRIIHRHGGQVWAESKIGEGATFYFTLGSNQS